MSKIFHYDASNGAVVNIKGEVLAWRDKSGNGNDLYAGGVTKEFLAKCVKPKDKPKRMFGGKRRGES
jgi:hypothetical protein